MNPRDVNPLNPRAFQTPTRGATLKFNRQLPINNPTFRFVPCTYGTFSMASLERYFPVVKTSSSLKQKDTKKSASRYNPYQAPTALRDAKRSVKAPILIDRAT